ncbi:ABC-F family ATP-binding cassette domain-containing protein [Larsenimonas suaedae]|uniref:ATP-binding cassette domain-containing protein n=1 Tax=Larsenimonas suaedae TaxID=1851019 RepID=A0ABU1H093_9GAMM|nr:ATP-binding cassette domain-containing protein [Larsenimonas suaedae]MCM2973558.1 ATP-binding cassette domain-containing protein [Larsenimonas suaedae]MDR5897072.1 ATP-binding cassette domain-containing protein [Larsenimonas suaedae]
MIAFRQLALQRGGTPLITPSDVRINDGNRVGIVGPNGAGKSSLFKLLLGELTPDQGGIDVTAGMRMAHMAQELDALDRPIVEVVMDGDAGLRRVEAELAEARAAENHQREAELHGQWDTLDGYTARARAEQLLTGLGFRSDQLTSPLSAFSGGWRMRVNLAKTLFTPSDLLLLDEPTNHLDLDALLWLEQWLIRYPGTLLLISHDRDFLDAVCNHILHFDHGALVLYKGGFSQFERTRAEKIAQREAELAKQQARKAEIEDFVRRFRAKASKARQAQSRLKMLERMEDIAATRVDSPFQFVMPCADKTSHPLLSIDHAALGYQTPLLSGVRLTIAPGQRIGLLGPNGAGKSTLIKSMTGDLPLLAGERVEGEHLAVGYFAQHQLEALDTKASGFMHIQRRSPKASEQEIRNFLGGFGFQGDAVFETIERFSGGEKARLALALIAWEKPNLLLLDEPTNHLDLDMREALTEALMAFEGAVLVVSHDRHLLNATVDTFWCVADGRVSAFDGDLDDYRQWLKSREQAANAPAASEGASATQDKKATRKAAAERREQMRPLKNRRDAAEKAMTKHQDALTEVETALGDDTLYADTARKDELNTLLRRQGELKQQLDDAEQAWLEAEEALEAFEQALDSAQ